MRYALLNGPELGESIALNCSGAQTQFTMVVTFHWLISYHKGNRTKQIQSFWNRRLGLVIGRLTARLTASKDEANGHLVTAGL